LIFADRRKIVKLVMNGVSVVKVFHFSLNLNVRLASVFDFADRIKPLQTHAISFHKRDVSYSKAIYSRILGKRQSRERGH
jgi:hypothetical protein